MRKIRILLFIIICLLCVGCGETDKPQNPFIQLKNAMDEVLQGNYTFETKNKFLISSTYITPNAIYKSVGNEKYFEVSLNEISEYAYIQIDPENDMNTLYFKSNDQNYWDYRIETDNESFYMSLFMYMNGLPLFSLNEDMFELKDGVWEGNVEKILENNDTFEFYQKNEINITKYNVTLTNDNKIDTIYFGYIVDGNKVENEYKFSNIGTTLITNKPKDHTYSELTTAYNNLKQNKNYTATNYVGTILINNDDLYINYTLNELYTCEIYKDEDGVWMKKFNWEEIQEKELNTYLYEIGIIPFIELKEDMFELYGTSWFGNVEKILEYNSSIFELYTSKGFVLDEYEIKIGEDGNIAKINIRLVSSSGEIYTSLYTYSNIGSTVVVQPEDLVK